MILGIDTETTGLDLWHGCRPFMVQTLTEEGLSKVWVWRVNPFTREPLIPKEDVTEISEYINSFDSLEFQNAKYDLRALEFIGVRLPSWSKVDDVIIRSHCLRSLGPHDLKSTGIQFAGISDNDQEELRKACILARRVGKKLGWRIADEYDPHWPATKGGKKGENSSWWAADMWMPREVALRPEANELLDEHQLKGLETVCYRYGTTDTLRTVLTAGVFSSAIRECGLEYQYDQRRQQLEVSYEMEREGTTLDINACKPVLEKHKRIANEMERECYRIVDNKINNLESPPQLKSALYSILGLPVVKRTKPSKTHPGGQPSTDKDTLDELIEHCEPGGDAENFIISLRAYRKRDKAAESVESYIRGSFRNDCIDKYIQRYVSLHPSFNITGTQTTRYSSSNPNGQNIALGKGLDPRENFNLRELFGPIPGFLWLSHDFSNIELRIFAYQAGETEFIDAFENGESVHLLVAAELYPAEFEQCLKDGTDFEEVYPQIYGWIKNGNFSLIYGAGARKADATYHLKGAYNRFRKRFKHIDRFMQVMHDQARREGYITCIGGYRLQVPHDGPHKAVNYYVQGSAGWAMCLAMNRVYDYCQGTQHKMIMTIHDELVTKVSASSRWLMIAHKIAQLMESTGKDLGMPLPVKASVIRNNWGHEEKIDLKKKILLPVGKV